MPRKRRSIEVNEQDDNDNNNDDDDDTDSFMNVGKFTAAVDDDGDDAASQMFSSQAPELTQDIPQVKEFERTKLQEMSANQREKALTDLSRLVLFKALAGEAIDKTKCIKEAGISDSRISSAAFEQVKKMLDDCFGFSVKRLPHWMERIKGVSKTQKERYYVTNGLLEVEGSHSRALHMVHDQPSIEKGFLMVVLAFIYCKGEPRNDGSRWLKDAELYNLLHSLDDNMPSEPPTIKRAKAAAVVGSMTQQSIVGQTPNVDVLLVKFCHRDYLIKEKARAEETNTTGMDTDGETYYFTMGPRAAIEIGRRQVIFFCAEILDQEPDPIMLQELDEVIVQSGIPAE